MTRIAHLSDTHGTFPTLPDNVEIIVHTGDFYPDAPRTFNGMSYKDNSIIFQTQWIHAHIENMKNMLQDRPLVIIGGNHCFKSAHETAFVLNKHGIQATGLEDSIGTVNDVCFYGFPWVYTINSQAFFHQCNEREMKEKLSIAKNHLLMHDVDIFLSHGPLFEILDGSQKYGNLQLKDMLDSLPFSKRPVAFCHGHIHESNGISIYSNMLISNAATTINVIEIK